MRSHASDCRSTGGVVCRQMLAWDTEVLFVIAVGELQVKDCLRKFNPYKQRVEGMHKPYLPGLRLVSDCGGVLS